MPRLKKIKVKTDNGAITGGTITTTGTISHSTAAGYKHIPSGGSGGQYLRNLSDGAAMWYSPSSAIDTSDPSPYDIPCEKAVVDIIPTNNNQLTNGAGYITGISGSDVTSALGYTPQAQISDTGWQTLTLASGFSAATGTPSSPPRRRGIHKLGQGNSQKVLQGADCRHSCGS